MLIEGIWDMRTKTAGRRFPAIIVIAPGPTGYLVRMKNGEIVGDYRGDVLGAGMVALIGPVDWAFDAADEGRQMIVTRTSRLLGLFTRIATATYDRRTVS